MVSFVVEEVERVKQLFEEKEARLTAKRDEAAAAAKDAAQQAAHSAAELASVTEHLAAAASDVEVRCGAHNLQLHTGWPAVNKGHRPTKPAKLRPD